MCGTCRRRRRSRRRKKKRRRRRRRRSDDNKGKGNSKELMIKIVRFISGGEL